MASLSCPLRLYASATTIYVIVTGVIVLCLIDVIEWIE